MALTLSKLQERLERSFYEVIRKNLVSFGYLPDITDTLTFGEYPYTRANTLAWEDALRTIRDEKGFAIELFQNSETKGEKKVPRIVIITRRVLAGESGGLVNEVSLSDPNNPGDFLSTLMDPQSSNYYFDVHLISKSAAQDRVLNSIMAMSIGMRKFIPMYDAPEDYFLMERVSDFDIPDPMEDVLERVYSHRTSDIFDQTPIQETTPVSKLKEIRVDIDAVPNDVKMDDIEKLLPYKDDEDDAVKADSTGISYE